MGRGRAEAGRTGAGVGRELAGQADELRSRFLGGVGRLAAHAHRGARRVKDAASDLRTSPVVQHALAARERGNLEAAFWLLGEAFGSAPDDPVVALHYWDVALALGRVDIASAAGVKLVESRASAGEAELAAQHWLELVGGAPDALVSPAAIAVLLPELKRRFADATEGGLYDRETLAGHLRRAVRHAVDPRNSGLHPGVALRIFEAGRDINPEASRRAAEAALGFPDLHEAKRQRLEDWLSGRSREAADRAPAADPEPDARAARVGLSTQEIEQAASRLPPSRPPAGARVAPPDATEASPPAGARVTTGVGSVAGLRVSPGTLVALEDEGLAVSGYPDGCLPYAAIQAVAVAEVGDMAADPVTIIDLVTNWTRRAEEPLRIVRLRVDELDLASLVDPGHGLGSDLAALLGEIMERTRAIPLPDPDSVLGTRVACFETSEHYERDALRVPRG